MIDRNVLHNKNRPLQIVHDFKFVALNVKDDYSLLDTLDRDGKLNYIKARIDRLCRLGYGGVVMNVDYKNYLKEPSAFELFFDCARYAKERGMRVWIYDEQYYPSGSAGGLTLVGHPEYEALGLCCVSSDFYVDESLGAVRVASPFGYSELKYAIAAPIVNGEVRHSERIDVSHCRDIGGGLCFDAPFGEWRVWCFFLRPLYELTKFCQGTRASRRFINVFNKEAVERFYKVTFEDGYMAYANGKLGDVVDAVFTDEPYSPFYARYHHDYGKTKRTEMPSCSVYDKPYEEVQIYPYVPWDVSLPERFLERYGYSVVDALPDIFDETPGTKRARIDFYALLSDMSREAFPLQIAEKLVREGVVFSGHYFGEENFDYHPIFYGDALDHLGVMGIPGCDCLWSDLDILRYYSACKLGSSAAHLEGRDKVMIEASNMVDGDQDITLPRLKAAISTMFAHGINCITSYYGEHLLPDHEMREFTDHIASLSDLLHGGTYCVNTLLYYPFENLCADRTPMGITEGTYVPEDHLGINNTVADLIKHQVQFDLINKKKLCSCEVLDGCIVTPNKQRVKYVVIPDVTWLDSEVAQLLFLAERKGVKVIFSGEKREICNVTFTKEYLNNGVYPSQDLELTKENSHIVTSHREFVHKDIFMLVNTDNEDCNADVRVELDEVQGLCFVDIKSGERREALYTVADGRAHLSVDMKAYETVIIERYKV